jgi:hypothetical protein
MNRNSRLLFLVATAGWLQLATPTIRAAQLECAGLSESCGEGVECCFPNDCQQGYCVAPPECSEYNQTCGSTESCCDDLVCREGLCQECGEVGAYCFDANECCGQLGFGCEENQCCKGESISCGYDEECCGSGNGDIVCIGWTSGECGECVETFSFRTCWEAADCCDYGFGAECQEGACVPAGR